MGKFYFLLLIPMFALAQISGKVTDVSGKPIAFANIFPESGKDGISAEEDGTFKIKPASADAKFHVTALGFKTKTVTGAELSLVVLEPEAIALAEVNVKKPKKKKTVHIGKFANSGIRWYRNDVVAKYFNPAEKTDYPFLEEIHFNADSKIDSAKVNIRLMAANPDGSPGADLLDKNLLAAVRKGDKINTVDMRAFQIEIPENGFFVAVEILRINQNRFFKTMDYKGVTGETMKRQSMSYQPLLGLLPSEENQTWYFDGKWQRHDRVTIDDPDSYSNLLMRKYHQKYLDATIGITLSN